MFNNEAIEERLLETPKGQSLFKLFFRVSYDRWNRNNIKPAQLYSTYELLLCDNCGVDILSQEVEEKRGSLIGFVRDVDFSKENDYRKQKFVHIYSACKGMCDDTLDNKFLSRGLSVDWKDVGELKITVEYMRWVMSFLNNYQEESLVFEDIAFEKVKKIIMAIEQYTMRELSDKEVSREETLNMLPKWLR